METKRNLEIIWLLGKLSLDHKTIANFWHENSKVLKQVFLDFVGLCVKLGLYGREWAAIDGSTFKAVNSKDRNVTMAKLWDRIARLKEDLHELDGNDGREDSSSEKTAAAINQIITELSGRKERYKIYEEEIEWTGDTQKSPTDPDSRLMAANGMMDICYNVLTVVDAKHKPVVEFEVTNEGTDKNQITARAERTKAIWKNRGSGRRGIRQRTEYG
jgi:transposase